MTPMNNTNPRTEKPNTIPWPPIIVICTLAIGFILRGLLPLGFPQTILGDLLFGLGIMLIIAALLIDIAAMRTMHRARTTIMPHKGSDHLVTKGIFAFSRNPIYLANTMLITGFGLASGTFWHLILMPVAAFAMRKLAIEREEKHLETRFGSSFRAYKKKANRWI